MYSPRSSAARRPPSSPYVTALTRSAARRSAGTAAGRDASLLSQSQAQSPARGISPLTVSPRRSLMRRSCGVLFQPSPMLLEGSASYALQRYGSSLSVAVMEALAMASANEELSVGLDTLGWAWLVYGDRLFIWKVGHSFLSKPSVFKELKLPPTEFAHSADLVAIHCRESAGNKDDTSAQAVSVLAASPEGVLRYWPVLTHDATFSDSALGCGPELCHSLMRAPGNAFMLATVHGQLWLLTPVGEPGGSGGTGSTPGAGGGGGSGGVGTVAARLLGQHQGVLSGLGRRVSSMFNMLSSVAVDATMVRAQVWADDQVLYSLTSESLSKWTLASGTERLVLTYDLHKSLDNMITDAIWGSDENYEEIKQRIEIKHLDLQVTDCGVVVLAAAWHRGDSQCLGYHVLLSLVDEGQQLSEDVSVEVLSYQRPLQAGEEPACRLLVPDPEGSLACLYDGGMVFMCSIVGGSGSGWLQQEKIPFCTPGDSVLGGGSVGTVPVFFSRHMGLLSLSARHATTSLLPALEASLFSNVTSTFVSPMASSGPGTAETSVLESSVLRSDAGRQDEGVAALKAALLLLCRQDYVGAQAIVDEKFPTDTDGRTDSPLDVAVARLSSAMTDDFPASDPRWAQSVPEDVVGLGQSSLLLIPQLEDKLLVHKDYMNFLRQCHILPRLASVTARSLSWPSQGAPPTGRRWAASAPTRAVLREHAEKLCAALVLKEHHSRHPTLLNGAVCRALAARGDEAEGGTRRRHSEALTPADLFFREVTRIEEALPALQGELEDILSDDHLLIPDLMRSVITVNTVLRDVLQRSWQYRQQEGSLYQSEDAEGFSDEGHVPWTASGSVRELLLRQHALVLQHALPEADSAERRTLLDQLVAIADSCLGAFESRLRALQYRHGLQQERQQEEQELNYVAADAEFARARSELLGAYLNLRQYERAAALAEKYSDFDVLVRLCEETNNQARLQRYMTQFADKNFSEFVFRWYMEKGKRSKLLTQPAAQNSQLNTFLIGHQHLSWLHHVHMASFTQASQTLRSLAEQEACYFMRKKTLLSLSKLSALASDMSPQDTHSLINNIDAEQDFMMYQDSLPLKLLEAKEMDVDSMRVLSANELIMMYISDDNREANEFDFKKALDLLQYIEEDCVDVDVEELKVKIFCQTLLRNDWAAMLRTDDPVRAANDSVFARLMELLLQDGLDLRLVMPVPEALLASSSLGTLSSDPAFEFLLRANYEHFQSLSNLATS
ncbi:nuclear pore complex protein Nup133 [Lampetra planeri]